MDVSHQKNGQLKNGQCHRGYKGKQCQTREYSRMRRRCLQAFSLKEDVGR